ncbi:hypothetical protein KJI95_10620 [Shewanella sp. JM162201]|uniref:Uncharacterized protein n=1 Tax=Shewanella jiangmenensis TaxID=2837387 RepID=A0ABS5V578_9GAMM|nr:hypothetical protein [Shewanella jiangmenensis]MBT1444977.1 hypothetical protein [Shewanella jiangmenensis]
MSRFERYTRKMLLWVGLLGVAIIYGGFLYLFFKGADTRAIPWYFLLSPWVCVYFGLTDSQQADVGRWFINKFRFFK